MEKNRIKRFNENSELNISDVSDSKFTKKQVILLMEWARDRGERHGEILWNEWLEESFDKFSKIRQNIN